MSALSATPTLLGRSLDAGVETIFRLGSFLPAIEPFPALLAGYRRELVRVLVEHKRAAVAELESGVVARQPDAVRRYDALIAEAIGALREARPRGARSLVARFDRALYKNGDEILDDPAYPEVERMRVLDALDGLNTHLSSYAKWVDMIRPMIARAGDGGRRQAKLHDLAAGHGGFALYLKERLGPGVDVTASDLVDAYLDLGRARAQERRVDVTFVRQDATNLDALRDEGVDLFLCTQSLHHFPPGMVARMLGEAARCARAGVFFIDGERGLLPALLLGPLMLAYGRNWASLHDTVVSLRRMFLAEELLLLANLAPGLPAGTTIDAGRRAPGYTYVSIQRT